MNDAFGGSVFRLERLEGFYKKIGCVNGCSFEIEIPCKLQAGIFTNLKIGKVVAKHHLSEAHLNYYQQGLAFDNCADMDF